MCYDFSIFFYELLEFTDYGIVGLGVPRLFVNPFVGLPRALPWPDKKRRTGISPKTSLSIPPQALHQASLLRGEKERILFI